MRIAIVGCGTGGPAAALFFARQGHEVVVFERVADPRPVGAGLLLQPTGMHVLGLLGLLNRVVPRGARIARLHGTAGARDVIDLRYAELRPDLFGLGLSRGALFGALYDAVRPLVRVGVEVESVDEHTSHVVVAGERFDRAVVCDGAVTAPSPVGAGLRVPVGGPVVRRGRRR